MDPTQQLALALVTEAAQRRDRFRERFPVDVIGRRRLQGEVVRLVRMATEMDVPQWVCADAARLGRARVGQIALQRQRMQEPVA